MDRGEVKEKTPCLGETARKCREAGACTCHVKADKYTEGVLLRIREMKLMRYDVKGAERTHGYRKLDLNQVSTECHFRLLDITALRKI